MSADHTLLIVDDCAEDREVYRDYLSRDPHNTYEFCEAALAEVALDLFLKQHFDVVLLDFYMPDMTGLEFLGQLQKRQSKVSSPIIMLTGQGNEELAVQAMKQGVHDYLGKQHLQPEILQRTVRSVIQQSHLHVALHKTREQQRLIATTALRIRQSLDLEQVLDTTVAEVQQLLECDHVAVYQRAEQGEPTIKAELGTRCGPPSLFPAGNEKGAVPQDALLGQTYAADAVEPQDYRELQAPIVIHSSPSDRGQTWGYLVAHQCAKLKAWQPEEHSLLHELAVQLAIAIQQSELLSQTQTALEKAQELSHFKSQILATVSHEYRSPLAAILAAASTIARHGERLEPDQCKRFLGMIQDKARHMTRLVDNMLVMHQCELDQSRFEPAPMNFLQFVADIVEEHREISPDHVLILQVSGKTSGCWGDQGMLRLAIDNVLSNAIKFSPQGGQIDLHLAGDATHITLSISDSGIGIPTKDQPDLFQSFSRGSNASHIQGVGLGLSIAKACIDLHGGSLGLESEEDQGTQVFLRLPKHPKGVEDLVA